MVVTPRGELTWVPSDEQGPSTNMVTVGVTDGPLSATQQFVVVVQEVAPVGVRTGGVALDGYVTGATVFFDANRNGQRDAGEPSTTTDEFGQYSLDLSLTDFDLNHNGRIDATEGRVVRLGGRDLATGLTSEIPAMGPVGSTVLGPLSSLVEAVQSASPLLSAQEAESMVAAALGLPAGTAILQLDPIASAADNNPVAAEVMVAAAQVQDSLVQIASLLGAGGGGGAAVSTAVLESLATTITGGQPVELATTSAVLELIQQAASNQGVTLDPAVQVAAAQVVAAGNTAKVEVSQTGTALDVVERISQVQTVTQGAGATALAALAAGEKAVEEVVSGNTGAALDGMIAAAPVGDLLGTERRVGTFSFVAQTPRVLENGLVVTPLRVQRTDGNQGAARVILSLSSTDATAGVDYVASDIAVDFAEGEILKTVDLGGVVLNDSTPEGTEMLRVTLRLATGAPAGLKAAILIAACPPGRPGIASMVIWTAGAFSTSVATG
jgi:hypothetical protein